MAVILVFDTICHLNLSFFSAEYHIYNSSELTAEIYSDAPCTAMTPISDFVLSLL